MAADVGHAHPPATGLPRVAWGMVAVVALVVAAAWGLTLRTAQDFGTLLMAQVSGAAPVDMLLYLAISGVMMVAMMLPSALPMVAVYRSLASADAGSAEARLRTVLFAAGYFLVWTAFTALSLAALAALGVMDAAGGLAALAPGALLVGAGVYQLTRWKRFCLSHCRTPMGFVMAHWKGGRKGAVRMGLDHAAYCLGCCWLLMLVLFTAGAMSALWMGVFALLVLGEKTWSRGEQLTRVMGIAGIAVGLLFLGVAWSAPPAAPVDGMAMGA